MGSIGVYPGSRTESRRIPYLRLRRRARPPHTAASAGNLRAYAAVSTGDHGGSGSELAESSRHGFGVFAGESGEDSGLGAIGRDHGCQREEPLKENTGSGGVE